MLRLLVVSRHSTIPRLALRHTIGASVRESFMSSRHDATLRAIFEIPVRSDVAWSDIESLLRHLGAAITEGRGSRLRVVLNGVRAVFHRPHPQKETDKGALASVERFMNEAGIEA